MHTGYKMEIHYLSGILRFIEYVSFVFLQMSHKNPRHE